jgi:two-component system nitrogen regulation response regulator GlnG
MPTLLLIEDTPEDRLVIGESLKQVDVTVLTAGTATEGLDLLQSRQIDVVILDIQLPDMSGLEAFRQIHGRDPKIPVIFITGRGTAETAIEAMRLGAYEYLVKPTHPDLLCDLVRRALAIHRMMSEPVVVAEPGGTDDGRSDMLIGGSAKMQEVYKAVGRVAPQDVAVLLRGESGTGKELVARALYHYSRRADKPFLAINCAAIPEALLESELFGHEKGAFTGADRRRIGKFEQSNGGTIFLDEVGDMTPVTQVKVLRVLQDGEVQRVGGNELIRTDVRVIAATNRDLDAMRTVGQFRNDLYYRLDGYTIRLPALRERREDIPLLTNYFLQRFNRDLGKDVTRIAPESLALFQAYPWPGNVRELQSVLKQGLLQATGQVLLPEFLPAALHGDSHGVTLPVIGVPCLSESDLTRFINDRLRADTLNLYEEYAAVTESLLFKQVLAHTGGNLTQAAKILGINRATLRTKLMAFGIRDDSAG